MINAPLLRGLWRNLMPDRVAITYRQQISPGVYEEAAVPDCWWRSAGGTLEAAPSQGVYLRAARTWYALQAHLPAAAVGDLIVSPISPIDAASATWTVTQVNEVGAYGAWALSAISLQLAQDLRDTLNFSRPVTGQDAAGRPALASYAPLAAAVPCRVQPQGGEAAEQFERLVLPLRYTAYLAYPVAVRAHDLATDATGQTYTVTGYRNPDRIEELVEVDLEVIDPAARLPQNGTPLGALLSITRG